MPQLDSIFKAESIAVVGVSDDPSKLGSVIFNNIIDAGFKGTLFPVNPKYNELYGYKAYADINSIQDSVDLVVIAIPARFVLEVVNQCVNRKVKSAVIISAGFREVGNEGRILEEEVVKRAKESGMKIIGPNCLGVISTLFGINASFAASNPNRGNVAFVSQSGAICTALLDMSLSSGLGFSHIVSIGNKADIDEMDLVDEWMDDPEVKVVGAYVEEMKYGKEFIDARLKEVNQKPFVVLKPGKSDQAKKAMMSHTGSMAGSSKPFEVGMKQNGIIVASTIRDMFNYMMGFSWGKEISGDRIAILTNAGGPGIIATDNVTDFGFKMAKLSEESVNSLLNILPSEANVYNPVDVIGDALADRYKKSIDILEKDPNVDIILVILTPQLVTQIEDTSKVIISTSKSTKKPIIPILIGEKYTQPAMQRFFDNKIPAYSELEDSFKVLKVRYEYFQYKKYYEKNIIEGRKYVFSLYTQAKYREEINKERTKNNITTLSEDLCAKIAQEVGLNMPPQKVTKSIEEALEFSNINYPVVIKATNRCIPHKTDKKAVYVNIKNGEELKEKYNILINTITENSNIAPEILVQKMIKYDEELFIGATRDGDQNVYKEGFPGFGHLLAYGKGGIYTEIYKDIAYSLVPSRKEDIRTNVLNLNVNKVLEGARGKDILPTEKFINSILAIQTLVLLYPEISAVDVNPLLISKDGVWAVDLKLFV